MSFVVMEGGASMRERERAEEILIWGKKVIMHHNQAYLGSDIIFKVEMKIEHKN